MLSGVEAFGLHSVSCVNDCYGTISTNALAMHGVGKVRGSTTTCVIKCIRCQNGSLVNKKN